MPDYSKKERAELRRLASLAYERELGGHLAELDKSFSKWREGRLLSSELSNEIHEYHQHAAREVWSAYQRLHASLLVSRALGLGILTEQEIPEALRKRLSGSGSVFVEGDDHAV